MISFIGSREVVARYAADILLDSRFDSASITITRLATSGDCCVQIATDTLLEDIAKKKACFYFEQPSSTLTANIAVG